MSRHLNATAHTIYTWQIEHHPHPEKVYDWVRSNWHDLGDCVLDYASDSLKAFAKHFDCDVDWAMCVTPDRGELITFAGLNWHMTEYEGGALANYLREKRYFMYTDGKGVLLDLLDGECPFTGYYTDEVLLDKVREFRAEPADITMRALLESCASDLLETLHKEGEYIYSDEGLKETLMAHEYEFKENGEIFIS